MKKPKNVKIPDIDGINWLDVAIGGSRDGQSQYVMIGSSFISAAQTKRLARCLNLFTAWIREQQAKAKKLKGRT